MSERLYLNAKQIEIFRNLYTPTAGSINSHEHQADNGIHHVAEPTLVMPNIRQIQPINNRTILASFAPLSRLEQIQVANSPYNGAGSVFKFNLGLALLLSLPIDMLLAFRNDLLALD